MNLVIKVAVYMLLTSTFDNTSTIPILSRVQNSTVSETNENVLSKPRDNHIDKGLRPRRQDPVVQPIWTSDEQGIGNLFRDLNVRVTEKKLVETEAIRQHIQNTVDSGTFAVELDESDFAEESKNSDQDPAPESEPKASTDESVSEAAPEPKPAPESEVVPESGKSEDAPEATPKLVAPSAAEAAPAQPLPQAKPEQVLTNQPQPPNKRKNVAKAESAQQNPNTFLTWLHNIFMNHWGMF